MNIKTHPLINKIPKEFRPLMEERDGAPKIVNKLKELYPPDVVSRVGEQQNTWQYIALFYRDTNRLHQAIQVISNLYYHMITFQIQSNTQTHKGMPLIWMRDFHLSLGHSVIAKRLAMLTLCEDAIRDQGKVNADESGTYFRLAYEHGMSDREIERYIQRAYEIYMKSPNESRFPEWILQKLDKDWMVETPAISELFIYTPNIKYIEHLLHLLGDKTGKTLEILSDYILSVVPGFRTNIRQRTPSTDYDIVFSIEGSAIDFRSELGRYVICECKDWTKKVDFTTIAKFCRILASTKSKTGILFSREGISGTKNNKNAARELLKVFHDSELTILILNSADIKSLIDGKNLISILRKKYENVRFDLSIA